MIEGGKQGKEFCLYSWHNAILTCSYSSLDFKETISCGMYSVRMGEPLTMHAGRFIVASQDEICLFTYDNHLLLSAGDKEVPIVDCLGCCFCALHTHS